jgi:hypothetical protein
VNLKTGTETLLKDRTMDNVQNCDSYINIHRHKPIDSINLLGL